MDLGRIALLSVRGLNAGYGFLQVLWDVSLDVEDGEFVALIGPNGAGKTTTLRSIAGLVHPMSGEIVVADKDITGKRASVVAAEEGISYISESLNLFTNMSVKENLILGAYIIRDAEKKKETLDFVYQLFPRLAERENQLAGTLSGGERKMLAIARGIMSNPELLLVDEPSLGLAPNLTQDVFTALKRLQEEGVTLLLVEQNVNATLEITDRAYLLENGRIVMEGKSHELMENPHVQTAYLGI
jgi:ABC-type branched-subunit amino acid transport system ATPase component